MILLNEAKMKEPLGRFEVAQAFQSHWHLNRCQDAAHADCIANPNEGTWYEATDMAEAPCAGQMREYRISHRAAALGNRAKHSHDSNAAALGGWFKCSREVLTVPKGPKETSDEYFATARLADEDCSPAGGTAAAVGSHSEEAALRVLGTDARPQSQRHHAGEAPPVHQAAGGAGRREHEVSCNLGPAGRASVARRARRSQ